MKNNLNKIIILIVIAFLSLQLAACTSWNPVQQQENGATSAFILAQNMCGEACK